MVTRIEYGQRGRVAVHGLAGGSFEIPLARLAEFVTERGNPANEKGVADERFHAYHGEVTERVTANLREAMAGWKGNLARVTREFAGWLADVMREEMGAVSLHGEGNRGEEIRAALAELSSVESAVS